MKVSPIFNFKDNDDDTVFNFSIDKKSSVPAYKSYMKPAKSNVYAVPRHNLHMMDAANKEITNDDTIIAILNFVICILCFTQHGIYFSNNNVLTELCNYIRLLIVALALSSILWIVRRYQIKLIMLLIKYKVSLEDTLYTTDLYKPMLLEILIALLVTPPYFDFTFDLYTLGFKITYSLSAVITFVSMIKLYVVVRLFKHYTEYAQEKAEVICSKHSVSADAFFALKCCIQNSPFIGIGSFFIIMSTICAFSLKLAEEPNKYSLSLGTVTSNSLQYIWDSMWVVLYTTTTIGYGNISIQTHFGRGACIIACILGNMYLGMLVVSIHQKMAHTSEQNLSYAWISRHYFKKDIKALATLAIRKAALLYLLNKKWKSQAISPIKPNGLVVYKGIRIRNDLVSLTKDQYLKKLKVYRELKKALESLKDLIQQARDIGQTDSDNISAFEDVVRTEFPSIIKKIKNKIDPGAVVASEELSKSCKPILAKSEIIKNFTKALKRKLGHSLRRKTLINNPASFKRTEVRTLTNS
jgi:Ion channel